MLPFYQVLFWLVVPHLLVSPFCFQMPGSSQSMKKTIGHRGVDPTGETTYKKVSIGLKVVILACGVVWNGNSPNKIRLEKHFLKGCKTKSFAVVLISIQIFILILKQLEQLAV